MSVKGRFILQIGMIALLLDITVCFGGMNPDHMPNAERGLGMRDCLNCHQKSNKHRPGVGHLGNLCLNSRSQYPPAGKEMSYATIASLENAGSSLEDGMITCISCHDLSKPPPHIIKSGNDLCLICHI